MFGPESFTEHVGDPYANPKPVRCPEDSVLTSVPVELNPERYTAAAGAVCRSVGGRFRRHLLRCREVRRLVRRDLRRQTTTRALTARPAPSWSGSWPATSGKNVVALGVLCRQLRADGTLGDADIPGKVVGVQANTQKSYRCPVGQVATGISGSADTDPSEYELYRLRAALPGSRVSQRGARGRQPRLADRPDRRRQQHDRGRHHRDRSGPLVPLPGPAGRPGLGRTVRPAGRLRHDLVQGHRPGLHRPHHAPRTWPS